MKRTLFVVLAAGWLYAAGPQTFTGTITDTSCGSKHAMPGHSDEQCARMCVKGSSSQYGLFDGKTVLKLSDQKTPAKFAAQRVKITGVLNEKTQTIKVAAIEPADLQ